MQRPTLGERLAHRRARLRDVVEPRLQALATRAGWHLAPSSDYDVVERRETSAASEPEGPARRDAARRSELPGIPFDTQSQIEWAERELAAFTTELEAPRTGPPGTYCFENDAYSYGDAEIAYAFVRRIKPERVLELGSGFSTLVLAAAALANHDDGLRCELVASDPHPPRDVLGEEPGGVKAIHGRPAQAVPASAFAALERDDVLFVDTSHVVGTGGEVNRIVLEVLPRLAPGVVVHFHDIWLPYEYDSSAFDRSGTPWTEQYLLQAFLTNNTDYEVLFAMQAVIREQTERFKALVPRYSGDNHPTSFWIRRTG